jgi:hypothetical protein
MGLRSLIDSRVKTRPQNLVSQQGGLGRERAPGRGGGLPLLAGEDRPQARLATG